MSNPSKITIRVTPTRSGAIVTYSTVGTYRALAVNNVRNPDLMVGSPTGTGSKAFWEAILTLVNADIQAGNGGGT